MKIAIVNDMPLAIEALRRVLVTVPGYEVIWVAHNGAEAVANCARNSPDLVLMDLLMPVMDGVEATRKIMAECPCAVLVVTGTVDGNIAKVFNAMGHGAVDAVCTPVLGMQGNLDGAEPLLAKIKMIRVLLRDKAKPDAETPVAKIALSGGTLPLIAIGASTGGPQALADVLSGLPQGFATSIVIVQHVDAQFAPGLAEWLSLQSPLKVNLIATGDRPLPGSAWLACTNDHVVLNADHTFSYQKNPENYPFRPSVDVFFESAARHVRGAQIAVLLTGMGRDGARGLLTLRKCNWHTIAQDEKSSVVYGMPKAAAELKAAIDVLPAKQIGRRLHELSQSRRSARP